IDLGEFLASDAERDPSDPTVYCLHGVLVHSGDVSGGHYFAYLRPTEEDKWYRFDDDRVIPVLPEEVIDESYGGDLNGGNAPARTRPGLGPATRSVHKRITNAYMLVYIRKSRAKQILTPVSNDEIPQHLIKCLEEAKAEEERLRREYEERTRTLSVTVFDDNNFSRHQGFDMCYFDTQQPEDNPLYSKRFPRTMRYFEFKEQYAKERGLNKDDIRFWTLVGRVNKTVRLDAPIPERLIEPSDLIGEYNDQTLEKIYHDTFKKWSGLRLYCERKDEYVPQGEFVPCDNSTNLSLVLVKFYDPETQTMEGLGKVYVNAKQQIKDIIPLLRKKKGLSHDTELDLYEEIKPQLVERMDPEATFHKSEIQNGDIICFQLHRSGEDAANASHQQAMQPALRTAPEYFDRLTRQVPVMFCRYRPNDSDDEDGDEVSEANGGRADARTDAADPDAMETEEAVDNDEFELTLYSDDAYDTVAQAVARRIGVSDPLHLLFRRADLGYTKKQPIRRTPHTRLEDMAHFGVQHGRRQGYLYFEVLPMSIDEMENTTAVPVTFIGSSLRDEHVVKVRVNNNQSAQALIDSVHKRVQALKAKGNQKRQQQQQKGSNGVAADEDTSAPPISLRIYQEVMHRNIQPINPGEPVTTYLGHGSIIAEQFPSTSDHPLDKDRQYGESRVISVFQFTNYLRNTHGVPFVFTVFRDEPWEETWERIRVKLGMGKRDLTKVKAVVVPENASSVEQCRYIVGANVMHGNDMALVMPGGLQSPTPMDTPPRSVSPAPNNSEGTPLAEGRKEGDASTVPNQQQQQQQQHPTTLWEELAEGDTLALDYVDRYSKWRPTEKSIHIRS
ncbi:ubiquitin-specific protease ubp15, partial [Spiromyces aspiralis]